MPARRGWALPSDSFAVVMATGIVSVAARLTGHPAVSAVLAALAVVALVLLCGAALTALATTGRVAAEGPDPLTRSFGLFTFVAATNVVDTSVAPGRPALTAAPALVALGAWLIVVSHLVRALRSVPASERRRSARGTWLIAAVATESLALAAAQLARTDIGIRQPLLAAALAWWVLGLAAYVVLAVAVVRRLLADHLTPDVITPDLWVLMGAPAIATVAGSMLSLAAAGPGGFAWLSEFLRPAVLAVWVLATAWIPVLLAGELSKLRHGRPRYERARWSMVFPLGMYCSACALLATALIAGAGRQGPLPVVLREAAGVAFWVALAAWGATALGLARLALSSLGGRARQ